MLVASCGSEFEQEPVAGGNSDGQKVELPDQESWESTIVITKDGNRVAEVWGSYLASYDRKRQRVLKDSVHADFYNQDGQHTSVLTAKEAVFDDNTKNIIASGNVVVVSDSGVVLETEELIWDNRKQKIISKVDVKFTTATDTLFGSSFISDPDLKNYEIRKSRGHSKRLIPVEEKP